MSQVAYVEKEGGRRRKEAEEEEECLMLMQLFSVTSYCASCAEGNLQALQITSV